MATLQELRNSLHFIIVSYFNPLQQRTPTISEWYEVQANAFQEALYKQTSTFPQKTQRLCAIINELKPNEYEKPILHYLTHVLAAIHEIIETLKLQTLIGDVPLFNPQLFLHQHLTEIQTILKTSNTRTHTLLFSYMPSDLTYSFDCFGLSLLFTDHELNESSDLLMRLQFGLFLEDELADYLAMDASALENMLQECQRQLTLQLSKEKRTPLETELLKRLQERDARIQLLERTIRDRTALPENGRFKIGDCSNNFWAKNSPKKREEAIVQAQQELLPIPAQQKNP